MSTKYNRPNGSYAGTTAIPNRTKYQDDAVASPKVAILSNKIDGDFNYLIDASNEINTQLENAAGSKANISERLSVNFNADGTLKATVTSTIDDWVNDTSLISITRIDNSTFSVGGDQSGVYTPNRRIKTTVNGNDIFANILSAIYDGGTTKTTITLIDLVDNNEAIAIIDTNPTAVAYSHITTGLTGNSPFRFDSLISTQGESPLIRINDTGASGKEYALRSNTGILEFLENTGTEITPTWTVRGSVDSSGIIIPDASVTSNKLSPVGTTGQILTSNGAGSSPTMQDSIASWELISTVTVASPVTSVDFVNGIDTTYDNYIFVGTGVDMDTNSQYLKFNKSIDSGATWIAPNQSHNINNTSVTVTATTTPGYMTGVSSLANYSFNFVLDIRISGGTYKGGLSRVSYHNSGGTGVNSSGSHMMNQATPINAVQFLFTAGNIITGDFYLYGVRKV